MVAVVFASMKRKYIEVQIAGRKCYVAQEDFAIFSCMAASRTAANLKTYAELDGDAFVVRVIWARKSAAFQIGHKVPALTNK
jgi:hypothetical protein